MRYFVTGAAGFIGYHLSKRLLAEGHDVVGYDAMTDYYDPALKHARLAGLAHPNFSFVEGRVEDAAALSAAGRGADVIVHLAAQAGVRYSIEAPETYVQSNLVGSWQILELARAIQPKHLLMASTSSVYGANDHVPFAEADRADEPLSLYAATKKGMEAMAHSYSHLFGVPTTLFRFFTVYGPWGRPDMALFKFVERIRRGDPIEVYGHGEMARDFTYVDDLVEAVVRLADTVPSETGRIAGDTLSKNAPYRVVNIAGGAPVQLMEFIRTIERALGIAAKLEMLPMQPGDVPRTYADASLLKALIGKMPQTPVETGVKAFVDWHAGYAGSP